MQAEAQQQEIEETTSVELEDDSTEEVVENSEETKLSEDEATRTNVQDDDDELDFVGQSERAAAEDLLKPAELPPAHVAALFVNSRLENRRYADLLERIKARDAEAHSLSDTNRVVLPGWNDAEVRSVIGFRVVPCNVKGALEQDHIMVRRLSAG